MTISHLSDSDLNTPELSLYNERSETQLVRYFEPELGLFIAESLLVIKRALEAGYEPVSMVGEEKILKEALIDLPGLPEDLPVYSGTHECLREIAGYELTKGLLCAMRRKPLPDKQTICETAGRLVVLEEIMNPTNVGAIFRSAAALGMDGVLLTKGCSDPLYRRSIRVSMGNVFLLPWTYYEEEMTPADRVWWLKEQGFFTVAMALSKNAVFLGEEDLSGKEKLAVFMGSEYKGLCDETIRHCDAVVRIPMKEGVDSLNVAAASAVAFWEMRRK